MLPLFWLPGAPLVPIALPPNVRSPEVFTLPLTVLLNVLLLSWLPSMRPPFRLTSSPALTLPVELVRLLPLSLVPWMAPPYNVTAPLAVTELLIELVKLLPLLLLAYSLPPPRLTLSALALPVMVLFNTLPLSLVTGLPLVPIELLPKVRSPEVNT